MLRLQTLVINDLTLVTLTSVTDIGTVVGGSVHNQLEDDVNSAFNQITNILNSE